jgi:hypothetical protein
LEQALLALRGEIEFIDAQVERMARERARLIAALDVLEGDTPAPPAHARYECQVPGCGRTFASPAGLGGHKAQHRKIAETAARLAAQPAGPIPSAGELERTPADPPLDIGRGDQVDNHAGAESGPAGESDLPSGPPPTAVDAGVAAVLAVLDHPEWVDGAVRRRGSTGWERADGGRWRCDCGKQCRTLGQLRQHLITVINPAAHRPAITANGTVRAGSYIDGRNSTPDVAAPGPAAPRPTAVVDGLPFGCSCFSRFPTGRDWSDHVKAQPTKERRRHRLVVQPKAQMVDTGIPHPKPAVTALPPAVAALQDRTKVFPHRTSPAGVA